MLFAGSRENDKRDVNITLERRLNVTSKGGRSKHIHRRHKNEMKPLLDARFTFA